MGCGSCGTGSGDGKPSGCQSNGGCSTGGCNRLNVYNWLSDIPFSDLGKPYPIIEISFNNGSRKDFYRNNTNHIFEKGAWVSVEGASGFDVGQISLTGELVKLQLKKYGVSESAEMKRVLRPAAERDLEVYNAAKQRERETLVRARAIAKELNLEMKIAEAEFQADGKKVTFFYTADSRVDFRELIKVYASDFRAKVEMRQIGARQESGKVGGIGSCGRELCCSTWLTDFKTVNTTAARYQNLSINQTKLSGQCGRLKCCLNYELDTYMDALHSFPEGAEQIEVASGRAYLQKKDIFRNLMWYSFGGSNKQYPLTIDRVLEIQSLNAEGKKPEDLEAVELQVKHKDPEKTVDMGFVNDVGQLTLSSLSKSGKKKQQTQQQGKQRQQQKPQGKPQQQNKPQAVATPEGEQPQAQQGAKPQPNRPPRPPKPQQGNQQQGGGQQQTKPQQQAKPQQQKQPQQPRPQGQQKPPQQNKPQQPAGGNKDESAAPKADRPQQQRRKFNRPPQDRKDPGGPQKEG
jgi:cell fate regulator YaaT (PSP1 superfamily)